ncbi:hypothetical protein [Paracraurococcus lichenis]|uniref:DNA-binding protein n=1 Tax=Paracraurococcus lichenis TaxID=3064888 RepID=A0ABT9EC32_9PROT|nr:hypothetical protein [Paracraurococcus sp. LOR1-02]MDO9713763.1 hypothetical protein [Paracraurococcus sp. LOR1-02]
MSDTEARWMTFRELADELGISARAAEARARRHIRAGRWRHRIDNDARKTGRVLVPAADLAAMRQNAVGGTVGIPRGVSDPLPDGARERDTELLLAALRKAEDRADQEAQEAGQQRERAVRAEGEATGLREGLRVAEDGRRDAEARAAALAGELTVERQRATTATDAAQQAQARALAAEGEAAALRDAAARAEAQAALEHKARLAIEAAQEAAQARAEELTQGGRLGRAWRALTGRRGP